MQTLPREMLLSHALDVGQFDHVWFPTEPMDVPEPTLLRYRHTGCCVSTCTQIDVVHLWICGYPSSSVAQIRYAAEYINGSDCDLNCLAVY